jgi:hypothetical protein
VVVKLAMSVGVVIAEVSVVGSGESVEVKTSVVDGVVGWKASLSVVEAAVVAVSLVWVSEGEDAAGRGEVLVGAVFSGVKNVGMSKVAVVKTGNKVRIIADDIFSGVRDLPPELLPI